MHDPHHNHHHDHNHGHHHDHGDTQPTKGPVKILFLDPIAGASGDMFLGALVDLGVDFQALCEELAKLAVPGFSLEKKAVKRHSIAATKVDVVVDDVKHPHRHVGDLLAIIEKADLPQRVQSRAAKILSRLAEAESVAHRMPVEKVHLHEVGGLDCLVDVVGTCIGLELLDVDYIYSGPVTVGTGVISCAHGKMPIPAPGTLGILKDYPIRKTSLEGEMTTPTGAAIITALAKSTLAPLVMTPRATGYGAGTRDDKQIANMLRIVLADSDFRFLP